MSYEWTSQLLPIAFHEISLLVLKLLSRNYVFWESEFLSFLDSYWAMLSTITKLWYY